jgi:hypothetical protein
MNEHLALRTGALSAIEDLLSDARRALSSGTALGDGWIRSAAALLARAILEHSVEDLAQLQKQLRVLGSQTRSGERHADHVADAARLGVLINIADAGADLVRPQIAGVNFEPTSLAARILLALLGRPERFSSELLPELKIKNTQLSREMRRLVADGLVIRRSYGRTAAWQLSAAGTETATTLQVRVGLRAAAVTVRNASEFDNAVSLQADVISVPASVTHAGEEGFILYRRQKAAPAQGELVFQSDPAPPVLVLGSDAEAYVSARPDLNPLVASALLVSSED